MRLEDMTGLTTDIQFDHRFDCQCHLATAASPKRLISWARSPITLEARVQAKLPSRERRRFACYLSSARLRSRVPFRQPRLPEWATRSSLGGSVVHHGWRLLCHEVSCFERRDEIRHGGANLARYREKKNSTFIIGFLLRRAVIIPRRPYHIPQTYFFGVTLDSEVRQLQHCSPIVHSCLKHIPLPLGWGTWRSLSPPL